MDIQTISQDYMSIIMQLNEITRYTVLFLIGLLLVTLILRIVLSISYQGQLTALRFSKKDKFSPLLKKIINDYKVANEKGIANINTEQIVNKYVMRLNFIGWSFDSIDGFIRKVENQAGFIGVATLFIPDTDKLWCAGTTAIVLVLFWLFGSIFDYFSAKNKLKVELIGYVDNQEGAFHSKDLGSTIISFKNELQSAILNTNKVLSDAIHKMNTNINESIKYGTDNMVKTMGDSMKTLVNYADILKEPMNNWKENVEMAGSLQNNLNITMKILEQTMGKFETIYEQLDKQLIEQNTNMKEISLQTRKQIEQLFTTIGNLDENSKTVALHNEVVQKQLKYVEDNQQLLNLTLQKYEGTIENFAVNIGDAFGNIINLYSQNATENITSEINQITYKFAETNKEFINNVNDGIDKLTKQSIIQQQAIIDIKEHLSYNNQ